ncbi:MAG TPA: PIG-L deacetylase family protein [Pseudonocardiaceae bacterium]|jgi:LmbE family N-acetylglucosaminyl deacetylase
MTDKLQPIDESWSTALAVVAHPDDLEYGAAAAVTKWRAQGKRVVYCMVTSGEAGIDSMPPEQAGPLREQEERSAAAVVGVETVEFLGYPDGTLEYGLPLRRDIARLIRRHRPEVLITANYDQAWEGGWLNQADHVAAGRAAVDAVRDAGNRWVFRELLSENLEPWQGVRMVLVAASPRAAHGVDISDHFETGIKSLQAHAAYLAGLGNGPVNEHMVFLEQWARTTGERLGCRYALSFEQLNLG